MDNDQKIRDAASALAAALTEGGKDYYVRAYSTETTTLTSEGRAFAWSIEVEETSTRKIAP